MIARFLRAARQISGAGLIRDATIGLSSCGDCRRRLRRRPRRGPCQRPRNINRRTTAVGERYKVEAALALWDADPTLIVSSESLGIPGTDVDLINDLGIEKKRLTELRVVLRPATKHKFRFNYMPLKYEAEALVQREFIFNGQRYRVGLPVQTTADFTTYRFGYEYDFFYRRPGLCRSAHRLEVHQRVVEPG